MKKYLKFFFAFVLAVALSVPFASPAMATFNNFQGFEVNTGDWVASQGITRVASGGGTLGLTASSGAYYAELQNLHDGYQPLSGDGGYSFYGGKDSKYHGAFYQAIDVYVDVAWAPPDPAYLDTFWIDMTPYHADPDNYGAEHNFRLKATGSAVEVRVDGQADPMTTLTTSGWYTFMMTYRRDADLNQPVITEMRIYTGSNLVDSTTVYATSPGGPFKSSDLRGNGYVWITVWTNGSANDVIGIDNVRTGLLSDVDFVNKNWRIYNVKPATSSFWDINKAQTNIDGDLYFAINDFQSRTTGSFAVYFLTNYNVDMTGKTLTATMNWTDSDQYVTRGEEAQGAYVRFEFQDVTAGPYDSNDYWWSTVSFDLNSLSSGTLMAALSDRTLWTNQSGKSATDTTEDWQQWQGNYVHTSPYDGFTNAVKNVKQVGLSFGNASSYASGIALKGKTGTFTVSSFTID